jgi:hypothetical protein
MTDTQARLDAIRRWQDWRGSGFPAGDKDGLVVVTELVSAIVLGDALVAALRLTGTQALLLERVTAALREIAHGVHNDATYDVLDCALIARAALAGGGRAAQEDAARGGDAT